MRKITAITILLIGYYFTTSNSLKIPDIEENAYLAKFDDLTKTLTRLSTSLEAKMDEIKTELRKEMQGIRSELSTQMDKIQTKLQNLDKPASPAKIPPTNATTLGCDNSTISSINEFWLLKQNENFRTVFESLFRGIRLQNKRSGRCLDIRESDDSLDSDSWDEDLESVQGEMWDCSDSQKFILEFSGKTMQDYSNNSTRTSPTFKIRVKGSNKCITVTDFPWGRPRTLDNSPINANNCAYNSPSGQLWYMRWVSKPEFSMPIRNGQMPLTSIMEYMKNTQYGYFQIVGVGSERCIDPFLGRTENGVKLNIFDCGSVSDNQLWKFC